MCVHEIKRKKKIREKVTAAFLMGSTYICAKLYDLTYFKGIVFVDIKKNALKQLSTLCGPLRTRHCNSMFPFIRLALS
jgi:hypothetical protein